MARSLASVRTNRSFGEGRLSVDSANSLEVGSIGPRWLRCRQAKGRFRSRAADAAGSRDRAELPPKPSFQARRAPGPGCVETARDLGVADSAMGGFALES